MRTEARVELDHACPCGVTSAAWVRGRGNVMQDDEVEAQRHAALLIRLARCPACHRRDLREVIGVLLPALFAALFVEVVHLSASYWNSYDGYFSTLYAYYTSRFVTLSIIAFVGFFVRGWLQVRASDRRVSFLDEQRSQPAGPYRSAV
jgi:hypothetical protein